VITGAHPCPCWRVVTPPRPYGANATADEAEQNIRAVRAEEVVDLAREILWPEKACMFVSGPFMHSQKRSLREMLLDQ